MSNRNNEKTRRTARLVTLAGSLLAGSALLVGGLLLNQQPARAADVVVYKSPTCGCCKAWVSHLREHGFKVTVHDRSNMDPVKRAMGVIRVGRGGATHRMEQARRTRGPIRRCRPAAWNGRLRDA